MKKPILTLITLAFTTLLFSQPTTWSSRGLGGGGALFSPSHNPANPNEFYVACDMSELFHTTNGGKSYNTINFQQISGGHYSKAQFTNNASIRYCNSYVSDVSTPVKSTDGGQTWNTLPGNPDPSENTYTIHVDYNNPNRLIISYYGQIYISNNGGTSFTSIHTALNSGSGNVVGGVFFDGSNIYVGTNDGVLVSTNGGTSFTTVTITGITAGQQIWSFAAAKVSTTTRFFCLTAASADVYVGRQGSDYTNFLKGVYSVDYGSGNWVSRMTGITLGTDYPMFVAMAENDINTAYLSGSNSASEPIVLKTTTGGTNWSHTFNKTSNQNIITAWSGRGGDRDWSYGESPFGMDVAKFNANYVLFSDFGFVHKTINGGSTWKQAYADSLDSNPAGTNTPKNKSYHSIGLENTTCWQVSWSDANNMFACFSDIRGKRSTDGGQSWSFNYTGHTANSMYRLVKHPSNNTLFAGTSGIHDMYQSTRLQDNILDANDTQGKIIYSTDNGTNWQLLKLFSHPVFWIAIDPNNPNRAYASVIHYNGGAGTGGIYRTDDLNNLAASTWTVLPTPTRTEKHPASIVVLNDGKMVCTFSGRRTSGGAFTASSGVFIYDPSNNSWLDVSHAGMQYWTKDIVIDPNDATQNTWYVCVFSGWGGAPNGLGGLYRTTNRGQNWTKLTGTQFDRVTSITFNPANLSEVYLTTEGQGLWISKNITASTPAFTIVGNYPFRQPERVFFNPFNTNEVWVTSFGHGMKMGTLNSTGITEQVPGNVNKIILAPNPSSDGRFRIISGVDRISLLKILDITGRLLDEIQVNKMSDWINLSHLPAGVYFIRGETGGGAVIITNRQ